MYKIGKNTLFFGEMLCPPKLEGPDETKVNLGDHVINISAILTGAFKSPEGDIYLPITNLQDTEEKIEEINFKECNWLPGSYELLFTDEREVRSLGKFNSKMASINLNIKPKSACFIIIKENKS